MQQDRSTTWTWISQRVDAAERFQDLRQLRNLMTEVAERWSMRGMPMSELSATLNFWHDQLMRRTLEFTQRDLAQDGVGTPPTPFCWLLLGSGGRHEMPLHPDQDNALVYRSLAKTEREQQHEQSFFQQLGERGNARLEEVGYPFCDGFVMAANPRWNGSVQAWLSRFQEYADYPSWSHTRLLLIASDLRPLVGEATLAHELRRWLVEQVPSKTFLHWQTADHGLTQKTGLDFWERFRTEQWGERRGQLSLKEGGYLPLINAVRLWAVAHGIEETHTSQRIYELVRREVWTEETAHPVQQAFHDLHHLRVWENYIRPDAFPTGDVMHLKSVLKSVRRLQKRTAKYFRKPT